LNINLEHSTAGVKTVWNILLTRFYIESIW